MHPTTEWYTIQIFYFILSVYYENSMYSSSLPRIECSNGDQYEINKYIVLHTWVCSFMYVYVNYKTKLTII